MGRDHFLTGILEARFGCDAHRDAMAAIAEEGPRHLNRAPAVLEEAQP